MTDSTRPQSLFVDTRSKNARAILSELGVSFTVNLASADLIWMRSNYQQFYDQLQEYQLLNHIPNEDALVDKGNLTDHLTARSRTRTETDLPSNTFYPCTYRLYDEREHQTFFAQSPECDRADEPWILKPTDESRGIGIRIEWQVEKLRRVYQHLQRENPESDYIVQRYIRNPLLLSGRKSEIRLYWLIANLDPLMVLLYREGTVRLNTLPFRLGDYDNPLIHLTNIYQQKQDPDYVPELRLKWTFTQLQTYITDQLGLSQSDFIAARFKPLCKRYLACAVEAAIEKLAEVPPKGHFFGLYGADIILDDTLHPWLTEIQYEPGLSHDDPVKHQVVPPMLREAVQIVLEIQQRKRRKESLAQLDSVKNFEWIIDET